MPCVYALARKSEPTTYRYVGISRYETPEKRYKGHKLSAKNGVRRPLYDWMRKYDDVIYVTLEKDISYSEAVSLEIYYIAKFGSESHDLLNMTDGGEGSIGLKHAASSIKKMSKSHTGVPLSDSHRAAMSAAQKGRKHSEETRLKMSKSSMGKIISEEQKIKISESLKGRPARNKGTTHTAETKKKMSDAHKRRVYKGHTKEAKKKMSDARKGRPIPQETREKISKTLKEKNKAKIKPEP